MLGTRFKSILFSLIPFALLLGCGERPEPGIKIQYVDRPVVTVEKCIKKEDVPTRPDKLGGTPSDLEQALSLALAKVSEFTRYANKTEIIMKNCIQEN